MRKIKVKDDFVCEMLSRSFIIKDNTNKVFDSIAKFIEDLEQSLRDKDIDKAQDYLGKVDLLVSDSKILLNDLNNCQKTAINEILQTQGFE